MADDERRNLMQKYLKVRKDHDDKEKRIKICIFMILFTPIFSKKRAQRKNR